MPNLPGPLPGISSQRRSSSGGGGGVRQGSFGNSTNTTIRQTSTGNRQTSSRQSSIGQQQQQQQQQVNTVSINNIQQVQTSQGQGGGGGGQQQQQRLSTTSNPLDAKELLTMLDDDIHETTGSVPPPPLPPNSRQNSITVGVQGPGQQRQSSIGSNQGGASGQQVQLQQLNNNQPNQQPPQQQQQQQLMLLLQQQQQLKIQQLNAAQQQQQQHQQVPNNNNQITGMPNQQQQQQQVPNNNNMMQGGMQQNQMNSQQQQQIQKFLQLHGHQLSQQQRLSLQQQLLALQQTNNVSQNPIIGNQNMNSMQPPLQRGSINQGSSGGNTPVLQQANTPVQQASQQNNNTNTTAAATVKSMDEIMINQRNQLRALQTMVKTHSNDPEKSRQLSNMAAAIMNQQQQLVVQQAQAQQQASAAAAAQQNQINAARQSSNSSTMLQSQIQAAQHQLATFAAQGGSTSSSGQAGIHQRQPSASNVVMQQLIQQRQMQQAQAQQGQQQRSSIQQPQLPQQQMNNSTSQRSLMGGSIGTISPMPIVNNVVSKPQPLPSGQNSLANTTRVVPVSLTPTTTSSANERGGGGGVQDAALIYTKYALQSIVTSLNERAKKNNATDSSRNVVREYTIRDLSTCLGAWDLNVSATKNNTSNNKRQKMDNNNDNDPTKTTTADDNMNDGNADTAFAFYYERSCPILLDAKKSSSGGGRGSSPELRRSTSSGSLPFCVEDFGSSTAGDTQDLDGRNLPSVAGAIVLTYGADSKFTGGIGEEGVLTKAIVEFFYDEAVVVPRNNKPDLLSEEFLVEAEEQIFARVDPNEDHSSLIKAALHALSPSLSPSSSNTPAQDSTSSSSDDGIYIPTVWSGNTNRVYQYCLLGNLDAYNGTERPSKRLCVAIQKKEKLACGNDSRPAKGVCRITLTLSPASVLAKKKAMAKEQQDTELEDNNINPVTTQTSSEVHRTIRKSLRILRPPHLATVQDVNDDDMLQPGKRRRNAFRRRSVNQQLVDPTSIVAGVRCQHQLLVDPQEAGKVYVNGSLVVDCSDDGSSDALPAHTLFGVDFTLPSRGNQFEILPNKLTLKREYGALLVDALIFAGQSDADVAGKLLGRLITGNTESPNELEDTSSNTGSRYHDSLPRTEKCHSIKFDNISKPCLESIVLSSSVYDPVGIGAKAIGTKFRMQYGKEAFPCEDGSSDEYRLHRLLGAQKIAKIVPRRARDVLKRGAYLGIDQMASFLWTQGLGSSWDGNHSDAMRAAEAQEGAIKLLKKGGFQDVKPDNIRFVARKKLEPIIDDDDDDQTTPPSVSKLRCWYDASSGNYYVSDAILFVEEEDKPSDGEGKDSKDNSEKKVATGNNSSPRPASAKDAAYLLAFYIAKEHPNPSSQVIHMLG